MCKLQDNHVKAKKSPDNQGCVTILERRLCNKKEYFLLKISQERITIKLSFKIWLVTYLGSHCARFFLTPFFFVESVSQVKLNGVATLIGKIGLLFAVVTFLVLLGRFLAAKESLKSWSAEDAITIVNYFAIAITIIVVAVPEGLPLAVTLTLAFAMKKMMRDKVFKLT